jgi:hypothetical protein
MRLIHNDDGGVTIYINAARQFTMTADEYVVLLAHISICSLPVIERGIV